MASRFVIESNRFDEFDRALERAVSRALDRGAEVGAAAARSGPTRGYRVQQIVGSGRPGGVKRGSRGLEVEIVWQDWRSMFFQKGTYGGTRVKPLRFMHRAKRAGTEKLLELIRAEMRF